MRNTAKWDKRDNKDIRQTANSNQEVLTMTRYDERYDEFGYEREDYDGTVQLNEYLTPRVLLCAVKFSVLPTAVKFLPLLDLAVQNQGVFL